VSRPILANGKPYPRKRPVDWAAVRRILRHRQEHRAIIRDGFTEVGHFGAWFYLDQGRKVLTDARVHPDGTRLYVRLEDA
jgi:hypothetical protein